MDVPTTFPQDPLIDAKYDRGTRPKTLLNFDKLFKVENLLGSGTFGDTYRVKSHLNENNYALKILKTTDPKTLRELEDEVEALALLSNYPNCHPDIVCYYDSFIINTKEGPRYAILMEYIEGKNLETLFKEAPITEEEALIIIIWLLRVLAFLHQNGYVHRDIKPENIMITPDKRFKLIDFGLSCKVPPPLLPISQLTQKTCQGRAGTLLFMAPEIRNNTYISNPSKYYRTADIFSAGAMIYNLLTGGTPYRLNRVGQIMGQYRVLQTPQYPILGELIGRMVDLNPDKRVTAQKALDIIGSVAEVVP